MEKLIDLPEDSKFYKGTIIIIRDIQITSLGNCNRIFAMVSDCQSKFEMVDLIQSSGSIIIFDLKPNIKGYFAVNKQGIKNWVKEYLRLFFTKKLYNKYLLILDEIIYIDNLEKYFKTTQL